MIHLSTPINQETIRSLTTSDEVLLSGTIATGRDQMHKWVMENFIDPKTEVSTIDTEILESLKHILMDSVLYHCGPIVAQTEKGYEIISAGPTTSIREEPYEYDLIRHFGLKGIIGKGGMGQKTLDACREFGCVYLHAVGGTAALIAEKIVKVNTVYKIEFGIPEAIWVLEVKNLPLIVTMDAQGNSLHQDVENLSAKTLSELIN